MSHPYETPSFIVDPKRKQSSPCRDSKEVVAMFGYPRISALWADINKGRFPRPTYMNLKHGNRCGFWAVSELAAEKRRRELANQTKEES